MAGTTQDKVRYTDLLKDVAAQTGNSLQSVQVILESFFNMVYRQTAAGNTVTIRNFGRFSPIIRKSRVWKVRGVEVRKGVTRVVRFYPAQRLYFGSESPRPPR